MSTVLSIRVNNLNKMAATSATKGSQGISQLNSALAESIRIGCKLHKDNDGDDTFLAKLQDDIDQALSGLNDCLAKIGELTALRNDPTTADALIAKYNIDIDELNKQLEKG